MQTRASTSTSDQGVPLNAGAVGKLWRRMAMLYGHKWTSSYGAKDDGTWAHVLAGLNKDELAVGFRVCAERAAQQVREQREVWPPSAFEFKAMSKPPVIRPEHRIVHPQLPAPRNPEKAREAVAKMREALK